MINLSKWKYLKSIDDKILKQQITSIQDLEKKI